MDSRETVNIRCSKCGARYRLNQEDLSRLEGAVCRQCRGVLRVPRPHAMAVPVHEDQIVAWLQSSDEE